MGAAEDMGFFEYDDTHGWSLPRREATYRWFSRWLEDRNEDGKESELTLDTPRDLRSTETGQVQTTFPDAETVQSLNAALAAKLSAKRGPLNRQKLPETVRARLGLTGQLVHPAANRIGEISRSSVRIEKIEIHPETGITVPALAFVPAAGAAKKKAIVYLNPDGKAADAAEGGAIEKLAAQGAIVLAIDPRGWGESALAAAKSSGYKRSYQTAMRGILVGKPLHGMQTFDVLSAVAYLASRPDVDGKHISLHTKGAGTTLGIYAAVLDKHIEALVSENEPQSYLEMTREKMHGDIAGLIVPGVLRDFDLPDLVQALGARFKLAK
jgi:hypothetical protein